MYFDISQQIGIDLLKIEAIIQHAKRAGVLIAMDSNSRSTSWHDTLTNTRGRILEEFLMSKQLHIMNEGRDYTTFRSRRDTTNIDLTVINNQLLWAVVECKISKEESCSDHIIRYAIGQGKGHRIEFDLQDVRYIVKKNNQDKFKGNLLCNINKEGGRDRWFGLNAVYTRVWRNWHWKFNWRIPWSFEVSMQQIIRNTTGLKENSVK